MLCQRVSTEQHFPNHKTILNIHKFLNKESLKSTIIAGAYARFPPMAVKLNGEIAAINPSNTLCRTYT